MRSLLATLLGATERRDAAPAITPSTPFTFTSAMPWPNGGRVSAMAAENLSAVTCAINAIASSIATLPALVYMRQPDGSRVENTSHPVARLVRQPNPDVTWATLIEWLLAQTLLHGNGVCLIEHDNAGRPTALVPIAWNRIAPVVLGNGRLAFDIAPSSYSPSGTTTRRVFSDECLWLRDRTDDGLIGRSRLDRAAAAIQNVEALQDFTTHAFRNQATPSGALKLPTRMSPDTFERLKQQFRDRFQGTDAAGNVLLLENGSEWQAIGMSLEAAQALEARRFSVQEVARIYNVPPLFLMDLSNSTYTNAEQNLRMFAGSTLAPWVVKIESEASRTLFSDQRYSLEIDMSGLTRGDPSQRWQAWQIALANGVLTRNEVRQAEGWNPLPTPVGTEMIAPVNQLATTDQPVMNGRRADHE